MNDNKQTPQDKKDINEVIGETAGVKPQAGKTQANDTDIDENVSRQSDYDEVNKNMLK